MATTNEQRAEIVRAGGNLEPGYVYDAQKDEVRKMEPDRLRRLEAATDSEASAAKARQKLRESLNIPVAGPDPNAGQ